MNVFSATSDELRTAAAGLNFEMRTGTREDMWRPVTVDELVDVVCGGDGGTGAARVFINCLELGERDLIRIGNGDNSVDIRLV